MLSKCDSSYFKTPACTYIGFAVDEIRSEIMMS